MVATKYVEALGKTAVSYSNAAGRTQSNLVDLIDALHDLSLLQGGFEGASTLLYYKEDANCCPFNSTVLEALCRFVNSTVEMPFAKPIHRPKREEEEAAAVNNKASSSSSSGNNMQGSGRGRGRGAHVPEWLPGFPDVGISSEKCEKKKRVSGEEHWENCCSSVFALGCQGQGQSQSQRNGCLEEEKRNGDKLAKKRTTRVKFRINGGRKRLLLLNTYGGGGGINKLLTQTKTKEETEAEVESTTKAQILVYKRRKQR